MVVLDTHALIWLDGGAPALGPVSREICSRTVSVGALAVSAISFWEVALLARRGRITPRLSLQAWRRDLLAGGVGEISIDGQIGLCAEAIEGLHKDPADRLIVATAIETGARLLTADRRILDWPGELDRQDARL